MHGVMRNIYKILFKKP